MAVCCVGTYPQPEVLPVTDNPGDALNTGLTTLRSAHSQFTRPAPLVSCP